MRLQCHHQTTDRAPCCLFRALITDVCVRACVTLQIKNEPKKWKAPSAREPGLSEEADCRASHARAFSTLIGPILMRYDDSVLTAGFVGRRSWLTRVWWYGNRKTHLHSKQTDIKTIKGKQIGLLPWRWFFKSPDNSYCCCSALKITDFISRVWTAPGVV